MDYLEAKQSATSSYTLGERVLYSIHACPYTLRKAQGADVAAIAQVELAAAKDEQRLEPLNFTLLELESLWQQRLRTGEFEVLVAVTEREHLWQSMLGATSQQQQGPSFKFVSYLPPAANAGNAGNVPPSQARSHAPSWDKANAFKANQRLGALFANMRPHLSLNLGNKGDINSPVGRAMGSGRATLSGRAASGIRAVLSGRSTGEKLNQQPWALSGSEVILGFIAFRAPTGKEGFIQAMYVDPRYYRQGIGQNLFLGAESLMRHKHCPQIALYVEPFNKNGQKFYQKVGFSKSRKMFRHLYILVKELG